MRINKSGISLSNVCFKLCFIGAIGLSSLVSEEFELTVSQERAEIIEEVVTTMGTTNLIMLKFKQSHLKEISKNLKGMGSFNFLGYIFTHSDLKNYMEVIADSSFKFNGIMENTRKGFDRDKASGKIWEEIPGFAKLLSVDESKLHKYIEKSQWDELVRYLVETVR
jgi:hypothetical protein